MNYIAKFNPYDMSEEVILSVATGRKKILAEVLSVLEDNLESEGSQQHLLVWGLRGMGKSFFLKYLHIAFKQKIPFQNCQFVLLPEEQSNINFPSDLINMVLGQIETGGTEEIITAWEESEQTWKIAQQKLRNYCQEQKEKFGQFLLVVVIENINEFLDKIKLDKVAQSRFRNLLEHQQNFTIIGASPNSSIDNDYNQRIFKAFKPFKLEPWKEEDYFQYFNRRWNLRQKDLEEKQSESLRQQQISKLRAISKFTGGSPRIAVVLTDLLMDEDVLSTATVLYGLIDDLTPYYQDLTKSIRPQSRKLFDTLIRLGENLSQSEIAEKLNTTQNQISKPFRWLIDNNYVQGKKRTKAKSFYYNVRDRIYVLYYQRREIYHNQNYTPVWLLADFLQSFFQAKELKKRALNSLRKTPSRGAIDLAKITMLSAGYEKDKLPKSEKPEEWVSILEKSVVILPERAIEFLKIIDALDVSTPQKEIDDLLEQLRDIFNGDLEQNEQEGFLNKVLDIMIDLSKKELYKCAVAFETTIIDLISNDLFNKTLIRSYEYLGLDIEKLEQHEKAIEAYTNALRLSEEEGNKSDQAWNHEQIGWNLMKLKKYEDSIVAHESALRIRKEEGNKSMEGWNHEQIGLNLTALKKYEDSIVAHESALKIRKEEENKSKEGWNHEQIGWNLMELKKYEDSIVAHESALKIREEDGDESRQAPTLGLIGVVLSELGKYEDSVAVHENSLKLFEKEGNRLGQVINLEQIGQALNKLKKYKESISVYKRALKIREEQDDKSEQAFNLRRIAQNFEQISQYKSAIDFYRKAIIITKELGEENLWQMGHIATCLLMKDEIVEAWTILDETPKNKEKIVKELGDAIIYEERDKGQAAGFKMAMIILDGLKERETKLNIPLSLSYFFAGLIEMKISNALLQDITEEALNIFKEAEAQVIIQAALHTIRYIEQGKEAAYLEQLSPDEAIAVQAIVEEASL